MSLRLDGSVDRTQIHNVHVIAHIVKADATTTTLFLGFGVPKTDDAEAYFQCLKDVIKIFMPWNEFFNLVTSVVTDGEPKNTGPFNGLCAKLKQERQSNRPELPLFSIWCVPHRINLAWKAVSKTSIINNAIQHCIKLSSFFHRSGGRTNKLNKVAKANNLKPPLRYPSYFEIRWTEYTYNLCNVVLRNLRASMTYFQQKNVQTCVNIWRHYDRLHLIAFLADILSELMKFQKSCQSDKICILDVFPLKN